MKETDLVKSIKDYARYKRGLYLFRAQSGAVRVEHGGFMRLAESGTPDLVGCWRGLFIGWECKVGKNKQSEQQREAQKLIEASGGKYFIVRSLDDFIQTLT